MTIISKLIEVKLPNEDDFLKVRETLTRIGIASKKSKQLFQSCHILHKQGKYYIVHFKELFMLDGKQTDISEEDILRRNAIAKLISEWGLVTIVNPAAVAESAPLSHIKILTYGEKHDWELIAKYSIGRKH